MLSAIRCIAVSLSAGLVPIAVPLLSTAQEAGSGPNLAAAGEFPEAPQPQFAFAWAEPAEAQTHSGRNQGAPPTSAPVQNGNLQTGTQNSSSAQTAATQSDTEKSEHEKAEEQLKEQEHQRVAGVMEIG